MPEHDTYVLSKIDNLDGRVRDLETTRVAVQAQAAQALKWQETFTRRARQIGWGTAALLLALISRTPSENITKVTKLIKAIQDFMGAANGLLN